MESGAKDDRFQSNDKNTLGIINIQLINGIVVFQSTTLPTFTYVQAPIRDETINQNIIPGESKRFYVDINFAENSNNEYTVKFLAPVNFTGAMEITGVVVESVGKNLACLKRDMFKNTATYASR